MSILIDTPIEKYHFQGKEIFVKREDLAVPPDGPQFAKPRGLEKHLEKLKDQGVETVSYMDTTLSMGGWAVAYFAQKLGMKSIIFYPSFKDGSFRDHQKVQIEKWGECGAEVLPLKNPNRQKINHYRAKSILKEKYPDAYILPQGLPFEETKHEVAKQIALLDKEYKTIVTVIGSGTMCAGILMGLMKCDMKTQVHGVFCAPKSLENMRKRIMTMAGQDKELPKGFNLLNKKSVKSSLFLYDIGYEYTQREKCECPFPSNEFYDRKAWKWLLDNYEKLKAPILFWNIGSDFNL